MWGFNTQLAKCKRVLFSKYVLSMLCVLFLQLFYNFVTSTYNTYTCLTCPVQKLDRNVSASSYLNHLWKQVELAQWSKSLVLWYKMIIFWERYSLLKWGLILESILMNFISISRPVWKYPCKNDCKKSLFISDVMWSWNTNTTTTTTTPKMRVHGDHRKWRRKWMSSGMAAVLTSLWGRTARRS